MVNADIVSMENIIDNSYVDKNRIWCKFDEKDRESLFNRMVYWLVKQTSYGSKLRDELNCTKIAYVESCGILSRLTINVNTNEVSYCAGQDYCSEMNIVKRIVAGRIVK